MTTLRAAQAGDLDAILRLLKLRGWRGGDVRGVTPEARLDARLRDYVRTRFLIGCDPDLEVFLAVRDDRVVGFCVASTSPAEGLTGVPQTLLYDHATERDEEILPPLVRRAELHALSLGSAFLTVQIPPEDRDEKHFEACGYAPVIYRITHTVTDREPEGVDEARSHYEVRLARKSDHLFVLHLNTLCAPFTMPSSLSGPPQYLEASFTLKMEGDAKRQIFILEDRKDGQPCGFLTMQFGRVDEASGVPLSYIHEIAIHPDHWTRRASRLLMYESEQFCLKRGVSAILADVSTANPRALATATRYLGYSIEWRLWARQIKFEPGSRTGLEEPLPDERS